MGELLNEYLVQEELMVIPVLLILGYLLKNTPNVKDWLIPYALLVIGIVFAVALIGFTADTADAIIQGVLVSGAAVFSNQLYRQVKQQESDQ